MPFGLPGAHFLLLPPGPTLLTEQKAAFVSSLPMLWSELGTAQEREFLAQFALPIGDALPVISDPTAAQIQRRYRCAYALRRSRDRPERKAGVMQSRASLAHRRFHFTGRTLAFA